LARVARPQEKGKQVEKKKQGGGEEGRRNRTLGRPKSSGIAQQAGHWLKNTKTREKIKRKTGLKRRERVGVEKKVGKATSTNETEVAKTDLPERKSKNSYHQDIGSDKGDQAGLRKWPQSTKTKKN